MRPKLKIAPPTFARAVVQIFIGSDCWTFGREHSDDIPNGVVSFGRISGGTDGLIVFGSKASALWSRLCLRTPERKSLTLSTVDLAAGTERPLLCVDFEADLEQSFLIIDQHKFASGHLVAAPQELLGPTMQRYAVPYLSLSLNILPIKDDILDIALDLAHEAMGCDEVGSQKG